jgi:prepilin-type N-terminal cleavage/methylation domain-containing protein
MKLLQKTSCPTAAQSGLTFIEMMISVVIGASVMAVILWLSIFFARTFMGLQNYDDLNRQGRIAIDIMTRDIRQSEHLISYSSNGTMQLLVFTNLPGSSPSGFSYRYIPSTNAHGTLTRTWGAQNTVLLSNIDNLSFALSQRNPSNNFTFYPATDPADTKLIDVSWICSLPLSGSGLTNTESIQTAEIVVRN